MPGISTDDFCSIACSKKTSIVILVEKRGARQGMGACETSVPWEPWLSTWIRPPCSGHCLPLPTPPPIRYLVSDAQPAGRGYTRAAPFFEQDLTYVCKVDAHPPLGLNTIFCKKKVSSRLLLEQNKGREGRLWVKIETDRLFSCFAPFGRPALCIFAYYPLLRHNLLCHAKQY